MLVSTKSPFSILAVNTQSVLGYNIDEIKGQSFLKFVGPETDWLLLQNAITGTIEFSSSITQFILYDSYSKKRAVMVSCSPSNFHDMMHVCFVTISRSGAVSLQTVFDGSACPHALVSADPVNIINVVNSMFTERFGCSYALAHGRPLSLIQGANSVAWTALLSLACRGQVAFGLTSVYNPWSLPVKMPRTEEVVCLPVVEAANGPVRHILILFAPGVEHGAACCPNAVSHESLKESPPAIPASHYDDTASSLPKTKIQPRRKAVDGSGAGPSPPLIITRELLDSVRGLPLRRAAAAVGVSPTAFKKACRKLGLPRWHYQRRRPSATTRIGRGCASSPPLSPGAAADRCPQQPGGAGAAPHSAALETARPTMAPSRPAGQPQSAGGCGWVPDEGDGIAAALAAVGSVAFSDGPGSGPVVRDSEQRGAAPRALTPTSWVWGSDGSAGTLTRMDPGFRVRGEGSWAPCWPAGS